MLNGMSKEPTPVSLQDTASNLARLTRLASDPEHHQQFLHAAITAICNALDFELVVTLAFHNGLLLPRAAHHRDDHQLATPDIIDPRNIPSYQQILEQRRASHETAAHGEHDHQFLQGICRSRLLVPMISAENLMGILVLESKKILTIDKTVIALATAYAAVIANSLTLTANIEELESTQKKLIDQNRALQHDRDQVDDAHFIVMEDTVYPELKHLCETAQKAAAADVSILITGETGTGKDVLARALHRWSDRRHQPFIKVNCAALPDSLIESELFGHVKGAFSGAINDHAGRFDIADGGTLLLDEIGEMPLDTQTSLLRVLQEGIYTPVGGEKSVHCDVRIIAATHADLPTAIEHSEFREDLYFRLNVVNLHLPPLRERIDDLPLLTRQILDNIQRRTGRGPWTISKANMAKLMTYGWPGNIRELVNILERGCVFASEKGSIPVKLDHKQINRTQRELSSSKWPSLKDHERDFIIQTLQHTRGKIYGDDGAATLLGVPPTTLNSKIQRLNIDTRRYRRSHC